MNNYNIRYVYGKEYEPVPNKHFGGYVLYWGAQDLGFGEISLFDKDMSDLGSDFAGAFELVVDSEAMDYKFVFAVLEEWFKRGKPVPPEKFLDPV